MTMNPFERIAEDPLAEGIGKVLDRFWPSDSAYPVRRMRDARSGAYQILAIGRLASPFARRTMVCIVIKA